MQKKVEYYRITRNTDQEYTCIYSAAALQDVLEREYKGQSLKKLFVSLMGYLTCPCKKQPFFFGDSASNALLLFERSVLDLLIHAEGMVEYRILSYEEIGVPQFPRRWRAPLEVWREAETTYFYELSGDFDLPCVGQRVLSAVVPQTDTWAFSMEPFDEARMDAAAGQGILPNGIHLFMEGGVLLKLEGDSIEYYNVRLERAGGFDQTEIERTISHDGT